MRILLALLLIAPIGLPLMRPTSARACSPAIPDLSQISQTASLIALVEVTEAGGPHNPLPTLSPAPTLTPQATATLATPDATRPPFEATPMPTLVYPQPRPTPFDLSGIGGKARVLDVYAGVASGEIELDAGTRARVARLAREVETYPPGVITPCPINLGVYGFEEGQRYLVFVSPDGSVVSFGAKVTGEPPYLAFEYFFLVPRAYYDRFFPDGPPPRDYETDFVFVARDRLPVSTVVALALALRGGTVDIVPPDAGSAGLKVAR